MRKLRTALALFLVMSCIHSTIVPAENFSGEAVTFVETEAVNQEADFVAIYQQEANQNSLVTQYEKSDSTEYFAGSFKAYVDTPEQLQLVAPGTYAFIDQLVEEFNATHPVPEEAVTA